MSPAIGQPVAGNECGVWRTLSPYRPEQSPAYFRARPDTSARRTETAGVWRAPPATRAGLRWHRDADIRARIARARRESPPRPRLLARLDRAPSAPPVFRATLQVISRAVSRAPLLLMLAARVTVLALAPAAVASGPDCSRAAQRPERSGPACLAGLRRAAVEGWRRGAEPSLRCDRRPPVVCRRSGSSIRGQAALRHQRPGRLARLHRHREGRWRHPEAAWRHRAEGRR